MSDGVNKKQATNDENSLIISNLSSKSNHFTKDNRSDIKLKASSKNFSSKLKSVPSIALRKPLKHTSSQKPTPKNTQKKIEKHITSPHIKSDKPSNNDDDICKEYSALPTDKNGETVLNSPEEILFRKHYSLNETPSVNFDFESIIPVHYNGQDTSLHTIFKNASHSGKKHLGKVTLYMATSTENAEEILNNKKFSQKNIGPYGTSVKFADTKQTAIYRAAVVDTELANSLIVANVDMGTALIIEGPKVKLSFEQVKEFNCDSVLYRKDMNSEWKYAVFEPSRIHLITGYIFR